MTRLFPALTPLLARSLLTRTLFTCGSLTALGLTNPVTAAGLAPLNDNEIVISASRVDHTRTTSGSSITVLSQDYLQQNQTTTVADVLRDVPGLAVSRAGNVGNKTQVRIRGAEGNQTLVLIDGIEMNDLSADSEFDFGHLLGAEIERIEVLRGAQSALWGSDAMGGVINIVTKKGDGPWRISGGLEAGSFGTQQATAAISGGNQNGDLFLSATQYKTDGISSANVKDGNSEKDAYQNQNLHFRGGVNITPDTRLDLVLKQVRSDTQYDGYPAPNYKLADAQNRTKGEQEAAKISLNWLSEDAQWEHSLGLERSQQDHQHYKESGQFDRQSDSQKDKQSYQGSYYFATDSYPQQLTLALEKETDRYHNETAIAGTQKINTLSGVVEYGINIHDRFYSTVAIRQDDSDQYKTANTYRLALTAWASDSIRLHASQGTGVKNPSFIELYGYGNSTLGNPDLRQEQNLTQDLGLEYHFEQLEGFADITLFQSHIDNLISYQYDSSTFKGKNFNVAKASIQGAELSLVLQANQQHRLNASYTYTDTDDGKGKSLARRASHIASLNHHFAFANDKTSLTTGWQYNGKQQDAGETLAAFSLVNLALTHHYSKQFSLYARVENLLDTDYEEVAGFGTRGRGVTLGIKLDGVL